MKKITRYILFGITSLILIFPFLIPITKAQEWTYDGTDTINIPGFSVYPSEEYVFNATGIGDPELLGLIGIVKGNITDPGPGNGTGVWGSMWALNITSGKKTLIIAEWLIAHWNETIGFYPPEPGFLIPVENDGKVSLPILNNVSAALAPELASLGCDAHQVYPNLYSIAFWNTSNNDYFHLNYTDDGILSQWVSNLLPFGNMTLYSQPAQLAPVFSFTTDTGELELDTTDLTLNMTITDADNNNNQETDTDYLYRIHNGTGWTDWAAPTSQIDCEIAATTAGDYDILIEVKNMYGTTQEQITITYTPPGDGDDIIPSYPIAIISLVALFSVSLIILKQSKKLRL